MSANTEEEKEEKEAMAERLKKMEEDIDSLKWRVSNLEEETRRPR